MTTSFMALPTAVAAASAESAGTAGASLRAHEWIARVAGRARTCRRLGAGDDSGDDLGVGLQLVRIEDLGVRAVRDAEAQVDGLQLLVDVEPRAAAALDRRQRSEQRIDRRGGGRGDLRAAGGRLRSASRSGGARAAPAWRRLAWGTPGGALAAAGGPLRLPLAHARLELLALLGRHLRHPLFHALAALFGIHVGETAAAVAAAALECAAGCPGRRS